jgi:hypothetical protein
MDNEPIIFLCGLFFIFIFFLIIVAVCSKERSEDVYVEGFRDAHAVDFACSLLELGLRLVASSGSSKSSSRSSRSERVSSSSSSHTSVSHGGTKRR